MARGVRVVVGTPSKKRTSEPGSELGAARAPSPAGRNREPEAPLQRYYAIAAVEVSP